MAKHAELRDVRETHEFINIVYSASLDSRLKEALIGVSAERIARNLIAFTERTFTGGKK